MHRSAVTARAPSATTTRRFPPRVRQARRRRRGMHACGRATLPSTASKILGLGSGRGRWPAGVAPYRTASKACHGRGAILLAEGIGPAPLSAGHSGLKQAGLSRRKGRDMNNQHAGLSQVLADQRITERRQQAAQARLAGGARPPRRRRRWRVVHRWWQPARWPAAATEQPAHRPHGASRSIGGCRHSLPTVTPTCPGSNRAGADARTFVLATPSGPREHEALEHGRGWRMLRHGARGR
jgi:hypothetical protein